MSSEELREYCLSLTYATEDIPSDEDILVFRACNRIFAPTSLETRSLQMGLKCDPERAMELREQYPDEVVAGCHLNEKHWSTAPLEDLPLILIKEIVQHPYDQVLAEIPRKEREMLTH